MTILYNLYYTTLHYTTLYRNLAIYSYLCRAIFACVSVWHNCCGIIYFSCPTPYGLYDGFM